MNIKEKRQKRTKKKNLCISRKAANIQQNLMAVQRFS